jgi:hypothetical protein
LHRSLPRRTIDHIARFNRHPIPADVRHRTASWSDPIGLRLAGGADRPRLEELAGLDSRPLPPGPHLIAERDGRIEAAMSLSSHGLIANPFTRTIELCELLRSLAGDLRVAPQTQPDLRPRARLVTA